MPYNPTKPDEFRKILDVLEAAGLNNHAAIEVLKDHRKKTGKNSAPKALSRTTLIRFRAGDDIRNLAGLKEFCNALERHEDWGYAFVASEDPPILRDTNKLMAVALLRFFSQPGTQDSVLSTRAIRKRFAGKYIMYRAGWHCGKNTGLVMPSLIDIVDTEVSTTIHELQEQEDENFGTYTALESGFLFKRGERLYFIMRDTPLDEEKKPITAPIVGDEPSKTARFGVIAEYYPSTGSQHVSYFSGTIFVAGSEGRFPSQTFFCRPLLEGKSVPKTHVKLSDIPPDAAAYIADSLTDGVEWKT